MLQNHDKQVSCCHSRCQRPWLFACSLHPQPTKPYHFHSLIMPWSFSGGGLSITLSHLLQVSFFCQSCVGCASSWYWNIFIIAFLKSTIEDCFERPGAKETGEKESSCVMIRLSKWLHYMRLGQDWCWKLGKQSFSPMWMTGTNDLGYNHWPKSRVQPRRECHH